MPALAVAPHQQPNAFATGRGPGHAVVCVTEGLMKLVDRDGLAGVLAHELGHVKNHDMLLQTLSATMAGAITNLARFGMHFAQVNALSAFKGGIASLFSTHPPTEQRIAALQAIARGER